MPFQDLPDGGGCDGDPEAGEFAVDATVTPRDVFAGQAQDQGLDGAAGGWPSQTFAAGDLRVAAADQVTMPAQDRVRGDDQL